MATSVARPHVGIERLPLVRRASTTEHRESMNCKSCRKRKVRPLQHTLSIQSFTKRTLQIKCNRLRPICEACTVFQCTCVYDAIPKKRGPKTDVLEALLKRVDGLEKKLQDKNDSNPSARETSCGSAGEHKSPVNITFPHSGLQTPGVTDFFEPRIPRYYLDFVNLLLDLTRVSAIPHQSARMC